jgi:hypothetical protein
MDRVNILLDMERNRNIENSRHEETNPIVLQEA